MLSFFVSTIAFVVAGFFIRRYLDEIGIPRSMSRALVVFVAALIIAFPVRNLPHVGELEQELLVGRFLPRRRDRVRGTFEDRVAHGRLHLRDDPAYARTVTQWLPNPAIARSELPGISGDFATAAIPPRR